MRGLTWFAAIWIIISPSFLCAEIIKMFDGRVIRVGSFWEDKGFILYEKHGVTFRVKKSDVREIVDDSEAPHKVVFDGGNKRSSSGALSEGAKNDNETAEALENLLLRKSTRRGEFPPKHDFIHGGVKYIYIRPGVYQTEDGTIFRVKDVVENKLKK